jgi:hypothetical protein
MAISPRSILQNKVFIMYAAISRRGAPSQAKQWPIAIAAWLRAQARSLTQLRVSTIGLFDQRMTSA